MKRLFSIAIMSIMLILPITAQNYTSSRYYNPNSDRLEYPTDYGTGYTYYGLRIGPSFTTVNSDKKELDGGQASTGLNIGFIAGFGLTDRAPLFVETGIFYTEKGGKNDNNLFDCEYNLNYMEVPVIVKYKYDIDSDISVQPFVGIYMACGLGGKIKDYNERKAYDSFSGNENAFKRFDTGLRLGVGVGVDMFYADISYDLGLSNIGHDNFDECHTGALLLSVGVNF